MHAPRGRHAILVAILASVTSACLLAVSTDGLSDGPPQGPESGGDAAIPDVGREPDRAIDAGPGDAARDAKTFPPEASVWSVNGHGYAVYIEPAGISWTEAFARAQKAGGHLVTLGSAEESAFVTSVYTPQLDAALVGGAVGLWMGGSQPKPDPSLEPDRGWEWIDGTPWTFTAWRTDQPDNSGGAEHYLDVYRLDGKIGWNDDAVNGTVKPLISYIVEYE